MYGGSKKESILNISQASPLYLTSCDEFYVLNKALNLNLERPNLEKFQLFKVISSYCSRFHLSSSLLSSLITSS